MNICGEISKTFINVECQLPVGHDLPHRHEDDEGVITWEPRDVAVLRDRVAALERQLEWHHQEDSADFIIREFGGGR